MRVNGFFDANVRGALKAAAVMPRRCEKTSDSSALGGKRPDLNGGGEKSPPRLQIELVSQDETIGFDPFWDGPRLIPTFVAQLMGQMMADPRGARASVQAAYGSTAPRKAALLDRTS
jgi:hypothetical protein